MVDLACRSFRDTDHDWLYALNKGCVPAMNYLPKEGLKTLIDTAFMVRIACLSDRAVGAAIGFSAGAAYDSENFLWFRERFDRFLYIDRLMVEAACRGRGYGTEIYADIFNIAREAGLRMILCEVNEDPPNPKSMRFHHKVGFEQVDSRFNAAHGKKVMMLRKVL